MAWHQQQRRMTLYALEQRTTTLRVVVIQNMLVCPHPWQVFHYSITESLQLRASSPHPSLCLAVFQKYCGAPLTCFRAHLPTEPLVRTKGSIRKDNIQLLKTGIQWHLKCSRSHLTSSCQSKQPQSLGAMPYLPGPAEMSSAPKGHHKCFKNRNPKMEQSSAYWQ